MVATVNAGRVSPLAALAAAYPGFADDAGPSDDVTRLLFLRDLIGIDRRLSPEQREAALKELDADLAEHLEDLARAGDSPGDSDGSSASSATPESPASPATSEPPSSRRSRAEQSRINGRRSRGPRTVEGRYVSAMNAFRHGMRARLGVLPDEDEEAYRRHVRGVVADLRPVGPVQLALAKRAADLTWRQRRVPPLEAHLILSTADDASGTAAGSPSDSHGSPSGPYGSPADAGVLNVDDRLARTLGAHPATAASHDPSMHRLQRYADRIDRSLSACLRELRTLQQADANAECKAVQASTARTRGELATIELARAKIDLRLAELGLARAERAGRDGEGRRATGLAGSVAATGEAAATHAPGSFGRRPIAMDERGPVAASGAAGQAPVTATPPATPSDAMRVSGSFGPPTSSGPSGSSGYRATGPTGMTQSPAAPPATSTDAMRFSGSFGASATMPMPVTALAVTSVVPLHTAASINATAERSTTGTPAAGGKTPTLPPIPNGLPSSTNGPRPIKDRQRPTPHRLRAAASAALSGSFGRPADAVHAAPVAASPA